MQKLAILMTGSSGLIGSIISNHLKIMGHEVSCLKRQKGDRLYWNPKLKELSPDALEKIKSADVAIHLSGENIAAWPWTKRRKEKLRSSRLESLQFLSQNLLPHTALLQASATGYYGDRPGEMLDESSAQGEGFLAELAQDWENASLDFERRGGKRTLLRFGVILSLKGGFLQPLVPMFQWGLGAVLGTGEQMLSWLAEEDLKGIVDFILSEKLVGVIDMTAPQPASNRQMAEALAKAVHTKARWRVPGICLTFMLQEMAKELLLSSQSAVPRRLLDAGYIFRFPKIEGAISSLFKDS